MANRSVETARLNGKQLDARGVKNTRSVTPLPHVTNTDLRVGHSVTVQ